MKHKVRLVIIKIILFILVGNANAAPMDDTIPFVGADFEWVNMRGKNDWGQVLPKLNPGGNVYIGARFYKYIGLEFGYVGTGNLSKTTTFAPGSTFFTTPVGGTSVTYKLGVNGWHLNVLGYLPVGNCTDLILSAGYATLKTRLKQTIPFTMRLDGPHRGLARVGLGAQYQVTDFVGIRALAYWMQTSRLQITNVAFPISNKPFHDAYSLAIGFFFNF